MRLDAFRSDGEPCPYWSVTGCQFGDEECGPGDRACEDQEVWECEQGWGDEGDDLWDDVAEMEAAS